MGRLKKDHGGYRTSGLWLKYQTPTERKTRKKKDTKKWCRGKVGVEHRLERYFWHYGWEYIRTDRIRTRCTVCKKELHQNNTSVPLRIEVDKVSEVFYVQVKVNGKALPMPPELFSHHNYCEWCKTRHY